MRRGREVLKDGKMNEKALDGSSNFEFSDHLPKASL